MKKLFCYMLALVFTTSFANASIIDGANSNPNLYAHTHKIKLEPASSIITLEWQFAPHKNKIAGVYWLPDFQGALGSRTSEGGGTSNQNGNCSAYNSAWVSTQPDASRYDFITKGNVDGKGLKCYANVKCKSKFAYTSSNCSAPKELAGNSCDGKYESCACPSQFQYNASNCSGDYQISGTSCGGNYDTCNGKDCSAGGYFDSKQNERKCSNVTYGGSTCYSCYQPQCAEGGYEDAKKTGYTCSTQSYFGRTCYSCGVDPCHNLSEPAQPHGCQTTYPQCPSKCQTAYPDNCRNRTALSCEHGCQSNFSDCPSKCETCKGNSDCNVTSQTCEFGCAATNSCNKCTSCNGNPDCNVTSQTCDFGCAVKNSCDKCTSCNGNPCDSVTAVDAPYGCEQYWKDCPTKCQIAKKCTPTCTSETNCWFGSTQIDNGCGNTCTKCNIATCPDMGYTKSPNCHEYQKTISCSLDASYKRCECDITKADSVDCYALAKQVEIMANDHKYSCVGHEGIDECRKMCYEHSLYVQWKKLNDCGFCHAPTMNCNQI